MRASGNSRSSIVAIGFLFLSLLALISQSVVAAEIPDRPEKLTFPPLAYEPPDPAQFRVQLKAGPVAYVLPDRELPLASVVIYVRTGQYVETPDKIGLSDLAGRLLVRGGTASLTAEALEEKLDFLAARMNSGVGETQGTISLNLLSKDLPEGLALLREVLTAPRFQEDKLGLYKEQTLQALKQRNDDSSDIEAREFDWLAYGPSFWSARQPTAATIGAVTREDLVAFHKRWIHPANFVIAASGDFDRQALIDQLEKLFADWPFKGDIAPSIPTNITLAAPGVYLADKSVNQGRVNLLLPGVRRDDPDYFAIQVMNNILGGGGFTSRIVNRVRSDEGLAYSAGSSFQGGVYYPQVFRASFQSKSRTVAYAASIILEEMKRISDNMVTDEELNISKRSFIDPFPRAFATKAQAAGRFADDEFTGRYARDPHYWRDYRKRIDQVTREDVLRVAKKWLKPDQLVILAVGEREEILKGHPDHPVKLAELAGGKVIELPTRDPLTMEPVAAAPASK
ncbi:MAG: insulinase family protein [Verrucomicrobiales bacterium]|nr:insulinase family protein [Verrucomicrobiales bacterium]